ncbi:MAG: flavin reductase family protein [Actinomycetes bacterium]
MNYDAAPPSEEPSTLRPDEFRAALATVCQPVTVVTSSRSGRAHGTTVGAFSALSLDPPLVCLALDRASDLLSCIAHSRCFGVNVLAHDQQELAIGFARKGVDKFAGLAWSWDGSLPRLPDVTSWLACTVAEFTQGGDHVLVLGRVGAAEVTENLPLTYLRRRFGTHSACAIT